MFGFVVFCILSPCFIAYRPIVLWHGMGDSCCNPDSLGYLAGVLRDNLPGVYIKSSQIGDTEQSDIRAGYLGKIEDQVQAVCNDLKQDDQLSDGFNAIGVSQV